MGAALWAAGVPTQWMTALLQRPASTSAPSGAEDDALSPAQALVVSPDQLKSDSGVAGTAASTSAKPLPLYLVSVAPGRNPFEGSARIGTNVANPQSYAAGALLANGAQLVEIHSDHVLLRRGEHSNRLYLYHQSVLTASAPDNDLLTVGGAPVPEPMLSSTREVLADYLRPSPVYDGEVLRGYRVYPGRKRNVFARLGLQSGDVITAIDGMPIDDATTTLNVLRELVNGAALTVDIQNQHGYRKVTLDGALIVADLHQMETMGRAQAGTAPRM